MASTDNTTPVNNNPSSGISKKVDKSTVLWALSLILLVFTLILLLIALIVLTTDTIDRAYSSLTYGVHKFDDLYAYRYMLSVTVVGIAYSLLRLGFSIYRYIDSGCSTGKGNNLLFEFYGDKIVSYLLATGAAAGFGVTKDMNRLFDYQYYSFKEVEDFCANGYASASLVLLAFLCTAVLAVMSSYALAKRGK